LSVFTVEPKEAKIQPHDHVYAKVTFKPSIMASYGAQFEAVVEHGDQNPRRGKLVFDMRGEGALPTLKIEKPKEWEGGAVVLRFPKTRVGKSNVLPIVLKNDGQIPATAQFDLTPNESFKLVDESHYTLTPKTYHTFNVEFKPRDPGLKQWYIVANTALNPYEAPKILATGEGFQEDVVFERLPNNLEDEIQFGDCVIDQEKRISFDIRNNTNMMVRFSWAIANEEFVMIPKVGHIDAKGVKTVTCIFKSAKTVTYKDLPLILEAKGIKRDEYKDWDDSMTNVRYVTKTEYDWHMKKMEEERKRKEEEEEKAAKGSKKGSKKDSKSTKKTDKKDDKKGKDKGTIDTEPDDQPPIDPNEEADIQLVEPIPEPQFDYIDKAERNVNLKAKAVADYVRYESELKEIYFKPTLMYTSRVYSFKLKNVSHIEMKYKCKIVSAETGAYDNGYYTVTPKNGVVAPGVDEVITIKFSPKEIEDTNQRLLVISIDNLDPAAEKLIVELDGEAERPICHFELPPPSLKEKKAQDLASKYHIIEFDSLGTKIKNVKRFYVVNPTNQGYEFTWVKEAEELGKTTNSNFFRCLTPKGVILSGKKYEMVFEYTPDITGNHESYWKFSIPQEKIVHNFAILGNVVEPNVFLDKGSINFGPLLLGGKNKETVMLKNLENIPFTFSFDRESLKGEPDFGDSISVHPMSGVIGSDSQIPIEVTFHPKYELRREYNYNLLLNIKQKTSPINLNVKGIGYTLHHAVTMDHSNTVISSAGDHIIDFGNIFINEKKYKTITVQNHGGFNFDFAIKKSQFNFITITPESDTVRKVEEENKGEVSTVDIKVGFTPIAEYRLQPQKHYFSLHIISGPTYHFRLTGSARKPNVELSFHEFDFGPCYVMRQPLARTQYLEMRNLDNSAMSIETFFERTAHLDVQLAPGQVLLPFSMGKENVLRIPFIFSPRDNIKYEEIVQFDINGLHKIDVKITGEGIPLRLELEKSEYTNIDFGIVGVQSDVTKTARLVNYGKKAITISFDLEEQKKNLEEKYAVTIVPEKAFTLGARESTDIEIRFNPQTRLHQFKHELLYQIVDNKETKKLLNIIGCCHGIELKMLEDTIGFGSVVLGSKVTKKCQVVNLGDVPAKFSWDTTFCKRYFTIKPQNGVIPAHEDFYFEITFHPDVEDNDIGFRVKVNIEDSEPLFINLLGKCIPQTKESIPTVEFKAFVRETDKKKVNINNPTALPWKIKANITPNTSASAGYFQGKEFLEVPPNKSAEYEITYHPLSMTAHE